MLQTIADHLESVANKGKSVLLHNEVVHPLVLGTSEARRNLSWNESHCACIDWLTLVLQVFQHTSATRKNAFSAVDVKSFFAHTLAPG